MVFRLILPDWAKAESPNKRKILEGEFSKEEIDRYNIEGYNIYYLPNYPSVYEKGTVVDGSHIDVFNFVFVDMDLKEGKYQDKESFLIELLESNIEPTYIVDSGNGIHAYWQITDLDPMGFLKLQRRLMRRFNTDEAVAKIYQLMRVPGTNNTKLKDSLKECKTLYESDKVYSSEDLDKLLPTITLEDEEYCKNHYEKTYRLNDNSLKINDKLPIKFATLLKSNTEVKDIWSGKLDDRSKGDYRLGHIMFASGFTKDEAASVLINSAKALSRAPVHRVNYAMNIIEKIWTFEEKDKELTLSKSVREILERSGDSLEGTRFACNKLIDNTHKGFRLGQVIGLVAGSGVGKTAFTLNMFKWFVEFNPDYYHMFVSLEQGEKEITERWKDMCKGDTRLHDKVHIIENYDENGNFRNLSLDEIKDYILKFQEKTDKKIGCVVIDHIGVLKKKGRDGENQDIIDLCHSMKPFAVQTNTLLVMQSQTSREKAGIGDLELNKDAAYGTVFFESYCDYLITIWQPLKRCYNEEGCPAVTAYKFCKIRHKKKDLDVIKEDVPYALFFDSATEMLRELTQDEEKSFSYFLSKATNKRKQDRKTDLVIYTTIKVEDNGKTSNNQDDSAIK